MSDYTAYRLRSLLFAPGVLLVPAGVALGRNGWGGTALLCVLAGLLSVGLVAGNAFMFFDMRRWRRRHCPSCGSTFRVESVNDVDHTELHSLQDDGVCRHETWCDVTCTTCGTRSRFDDDGRYLGPADPLDDTPAAADLPPMKTDSRG
jgi:hypothetical protein